MFIDPLVYGLIESQKCSFKIQIYNLESEFTNMLINTFIKLNKKQNKINSLKYYLEPKIKIKIKTKIKI